MKETNIHTITQEKKLSQQPRTPRHLDVNYVVDVIDAIDSVCDDASSLNTTVQRLRRDAADSTDKADLNMMHLQELGHLMARYTYALGSLSINVPSGIARDAIAEYSARQNTDEDTDKKAPGRLRFIHGLLTNAGNPAVWEAPQTQPDEEADLASDHNGTIAGVNHFIRRLEDPRPMARTTLPPLKRGLFGEIVKYKKDEKTGRYWLDLNNPRAVRYGADDEAADFIVARYTVTDHSVDPDSGVHTVKTTDGVNGYLNQEHNKSIMREFQFTPDSDTYRLTGDVEKEMLELFIPNNAASIWAEDAEERAMLQAIMENSDSGSVAVSAAGEPKQNVIETFRPLVDEDGNNIGINPMPLFVAKQN